MFKSNATLSGTEKFKPKSMKIRPAFASGGFSIDDIGRDDNKNSIMFEPHNAIKKPMKIHAIEELESEENGGDLSPL